MSDTYGDEVASQIRQIRETLKQVLELRRSIDSMAEELKQSGSLSKEKLRLLSDIATSATNSLNNLASATGFLQELRTSSGPLLSQFQSAIDNFQSTIQKAVGDLAPITAFSGVTVDLRDSISSFEVTTRVVNSNLHSLLENYSAIEGALGAHVNELRTFSSAMTALPEAMKSLQAVTSNIESTISNSSQTFDALHKRFADTERQIRQSTEGNGIGTLKQRLNLVAPSAAIGFLSSRYVLELSTGASIGWTAVTTLTVLSGLSVDFIVNFIRKKI